MKNKHKIIISVVLLIIALSVILPQIIGDNQNMEISPESAQDVYNSIEEVDKKKLDELEETAKSAMLLFRDVYASAAKDSDYEVVISNETLSLVVDAIGAEGYSVIDSAQELNMKNPERIIQFGNLVNSNQDAETSYFVVRSDGTLSMNTLSYTNGIGKLIAISVEFDSSLEPSIYAEGQYDLPNISYTEKGWLIYDRDITNMSINKKFNIDSHTLVRVKPYDDTCRQLCRKYVTPVGYYENNLFTSSWTEADYKDLDFNCLFPILYGMFYNTDPLTMYSANDLYDLIDNTRLHIIPSSQFEEVIKSYFNISSEQLNSLADFSTSLGGYYMCGYNTGYYSVVPRIPEPEVVDYWYNTDGTLTLKVDAVFSWYGTDKAFTHEVTVRDTETGFEYVSNYVYESEDNIFPKMTLQGERLIQMKQYC